MPHRRLLPRALTGAALCLLAATGCRPGDTIADLTVRTEDPFRLQFTDVPAAEPETAASYTLEYRRNGGDWSAVPVADFPYAEIEELTPRVHVIASAPRSAGDWPLVIRRYADGAVTNDTGDRFEFRLTDGTGLPLDTGGNPAVTVEVPRHQLGGTFVETPGRVGPWQAGDGSLYFVMEPAESFNVLMVVRSTDGGATWQEADGANRPQTVDLEGLASAVAGDTIHMLHQISEGVLYHAFRTADHATAPATWAVRDEPVTVPAGEPPVQAVAIAVRSDGSIVGLYAGPARIHLRIRGPDGVWGNETVIDDGLPPNLSGPQAVLGDGDIVHIAYTGDDGTAWYRQLLPDGRLTPRELLASDLGTTEADVGSILPLVFVPATNTVVMIYRSASGELWERRKRANEPLTEAVRVTDRRVVQNAVDSDQTGADAIAYGTEVHVLFIEAASGSIFHTYTAADGRWTTAQRVIDGIRGQWVRGSLLRIDGEDRYGFVYDAGSNGGSGMNRYADLRLGRE